MNLNDHQMKSNETMTKQKKKADPLYFPPKDGCDCGRCRRGLIYILINFANKDCLKDKRKYFFKKRTETVAFPPLN